MKKRIWTKTLAVFAVIALAFTTQASAKTWKMSFGDAAGGTQWGNRQKIC